MGVRRRVCSTGASLQRDRTVPCRSPGASRLRAPRASTSLPLSSSRRSENRRAHLRDGDDAMNSRYRSIARLERQRKADGNDDRSDDGGEETGYELVCALRMTALQAMCHAVSSQTGQRCRTPAERRAHTETVTVTALVRFRHYGLASRNRFSQTGSSAARPRPCASLPSHVECPRRPSQRHPPSTSTRTCSRWPRTSSARRPRSSAATCACFRRTPSRR